MQSYTNYKQCDSCDDLTRHEAHPHPTDTKVIVLNECLDCGETTRETED